MSARYSIHTALALDPKRSVFLLIEWNRETHKGPVDTNGRCVGEYPSIEAATEAGHAHLLRQVGAAALRVS